MWSLSADALEEALLRVPQAVWPPSRPGPPRFHRLAFLRLSGRPAGPALLDFIVVVEPLDVRLDDGEIDSEAESELPVISKVVNSLTDSTTAAAKDGGHCGRPGDKAEPHGPTTPTELGMLLEFEPPDVDALVRRTQWRSHGAWVLPPGPKKGRSTERRHHGFGRS